MCGIVGGFLPPDCIAKMLSHIQHRGFMSAGIATNRWFWRSLGSVIDLKREHGNMWVGDYGIGHVRYCTNDNPDQIQPMLYFGDGHGFDALAFNGQVEDGDTERLFNAIRCRNLRDVRGAYCYTYLDAEACTIKAGRDQFGFHPLYYSHSKRIVASETCADLSVDDWVPVTPGTEIDVATGRVLSRLPVEPARCFFEWVYFSSVQSKFAGHDIWSVRQRLGEILAEREDVEADMVVPVPDTGIAAAQAMAQKLQLPLQMAIYRDRYAERTFINESGFHSKYKLIPKALHGRILLVDDSIIRGNTLNFLVPRLQEYADEVHVRVTCPPITHCCRYGINITEAGVHTIEAANSVRFLTPDDMEIIPGEMCRACVTGTYPI